MPLSEEEKRKIEEEERYRAEVREKMKKPLSKKVLQGAINRKVKKSRINLGPFSVDFQPLELEWYRNFLMDLKGGKAGTLAEFFTTNGDLVSFKVGYGKKDDRPFLMVPQNISNAIEAEANRFMKNGDVFDVDVGSINVAGDGDLPGFQFEADWQNKEGSYRVFERYIFLYRDYIRVMAMVPNNADSRILSDVKKLTRSIQLNSAKK